ncbi:DUF2357 domain-containing protein [Alteribacter keqinensis]|uniref:DUF2357 domain-containing protein n=1 Tax=Alteribacter keqinensis TaxID=2483800 RepID=A0A3M7TWP7_9BACI|nr:DUF2357 domain-containing protein [Alteribacter keqinensis]RNA70027.1 DUF2357 domain-containing protein [Alteribacter keqinensis]
MEPLNIGADVMIRMAGESWQPAEECYLTEATDYEWHLERQDAIDIRLGTIPLSYQRTEQGIKGSFVTPFQSGEIGLFIDGEVYKTYLYPDARKMTETQYDHMLSDVLEEAAVCFQYSGSTRGLDSSGFNRELSWPQWQYIQASFKSLTQLMGKVTSRPYRILNSRTEFVKREKVKEVSPSTERWIEQRFGKGTKTVPEQLRSLNRRETTDVYENQYLKTLLMDFERILTRYSKSDYRDVVTKAGHYLARVRYWLHHSFLKEVSQLKGSRVITQVIRKNPVYRMTHQWFERLFRHGNFKIGLESPISLKDTFDLYEMWCYFQVIKVLRREGLLDNTSSLFTFKSDGIFLNLHANRESLVLLKNNRKLYFQRVYQSNSPEFFTYTHRMIPDIVLEGEEELIVFDPKYRVPSNLNHALGEMHKYRDGILSKETGEPAVKEVYIMTPWQNGQEESKLFTEDYHRQFKIGAIAMTPGEEQRWLKKWAEELNRAALS